MHITEHEVCFFTCYFLCSYFNSNMVVHIGFDFSLFINLIFKLAMNGDKLKKDQANDYLGCLVQQNAVVN